MLNNQIKLLIYLLMLLGIFGGKCIASGLAQVAPKRTEIQKIQRNQRANVQVYRGSVGRGNWNEANLNEVLQNGNWLGTGSNAQAWMWYVSLGIKYRQEANTLSQYLPGERCGFKVERGKNLFLTDGSLRGCSLVSGTVVEATLPGGGVRALSDFPLAEAPDEPTESTAASAIFLARDSSSGQTLVGVLANPEEPVLVSNLVSDFNDSETGNVGNTIELRAGEFALIQDDGSLVRGEYSLPEFYGDNPLLALGLGNSQADRDYVEGLENNSAEKKLFETVRTATLEALDEQEESRSVATEIPTPPLCLAQEFFEVLAGGPPGPTEIIGCYN